MELMTKRPRKPSKPLLSPDTQILQSRPARKRDPRQPRLALDPMPDRIEPCLALLKSRPPKGPEWAFEVKWDGYRLAIHVEPNGVRILTRGGHDWTSRFPAIAEAARQIGTTAILDGEAVVLDDEGRPSFSALQKALGGRGGKRSADEAILYAFDILYFDGHDLTRMDLEERRHILEPLFSSDGVIRLSEEIEADGAEFLASACALGLEGIIAKHLHRPYTPGRTGDWLKIKCVQSESFMIVGYEPSSVASGGIGSLLLAAYRGTAWQYVGSVGTGFNASEATDLRKTLDKLNTKRPVVEVKGKGIVFVQPTLIAEIEFRGWTDEQKLRHASYKGLRDVQDNAAVFKMPKGELS